VRVAVAASAAYLIYHLAGLPQGYWAVFTAVIVVQASIGATLNAAFERMIGTIAGAAVGGLAAWLHPRTPVGLGVAIALVVAVTSFGAARRAKLKVAPVTAVIMLISPSVTTGGPLETAVMRVVEIAFGSVVGLLATLFVFPARAHVAAAARIREVLDQLAGFVEACAARLDGEQEDLFAASSRIRASLAAVEAAVTEAERERSSRLGGDGGIPQAIVRTLWRVRNDSVVIARIADTPMEAPAAPQFREAAAALLRAEAQFMRASAAALAAREPLDRSAVEAADARFQAAVEGLRLEHLTAALTFEAVSPVFGLVFAVESLHRHLADLADRIEEARLGAARPARRAA
jgi:uncharacterized membrane protein YccC